MKQVLQSQTTAERQVNIHNGEKHVKNSRLNET